MPVKEVFYKSPHNYDLDEESDMCAEFNDDPSLTIQSHAEDADINVLMDRFGVGYKMPENVRVPVFGDYRHVTDFRSAMDAVRLAEDNFMAMPAATRAQFDNDPQKFLEFAENPANLEAMANMGLAVKREVKNGNSSAGAAGSSGQAGSAPGGSVQGAPAAAGGKDVAGSGG